MDKVAIVNLVGFDGGGIAKLAIEYSKLGFDVFFKDTVQALQSKTDTYGAKLFTDDSDLIDSLVNYRRIIFLTFYDNGLASCVSTVKRLKQCYSDKEFCYLYCDRDVIRLQSLLNELKSQDVEFDYYFSINPNVLNFISNCKVLNVNAFTFSELPEITCKKPVVLTAGRAEAFKGTLSYFKSIDKNFLNTEYIYIHEGARFNFNKSGTVSTPPQLLFLFDTGVSPKQLKPEFKFNNYGDEPESLKLNIYPSYNMNDIKNRWTKYFAGVCCILGSKSLCRYKRSLFESAWVADDIREENLLNKNSKKWTNSIEYVNIEMIDAGLPVLFSRKYSKIIGFNNEALIYDSFSSIPRKLNDLHTVYKASFWDEYNFFKRIQVNVNKEIIKSFTEPLR